MDKGKLYFIINLVLVLLIPLISLPNFFWVPIVTMFFVSINLTYLILGIIAFKKCDLHSWWFKFSFIINLLIFFNYLLSTAIALDFVVGLAYLSFNLLWIILSIVSLILLIIGYVNNRKP